jgi:orotidine-5'-phosphate decarboxylase
MTSEQLASQIIKKKSYLCVGLDPDREKLPAHLEKNAEGVEAFCKAIIETTLPFAVSYKINTAFFESLGASGWLAMFRVFDYLKEKNVFTIADAKRGDIGNTSHQYARAFFEQLGADAITLAPYMGEDSISPFLQYENKTAILLALTSNPGHADFEMQTLVSGKKLYAEVIEKALSWPAKADLMFVVGATRASEIENIRKICPENFFLVPGVGAQGGSLREISEKGMIKKVGLLVNASRSILFASSGIDFAQKAALEAEKIQKEMEIILKERQFLKA